MVSVAIITTRSITNSLTHSLIRAPTPTLPLPLTHELTHSPAHSLSHLIEHLASSREEKKSYDVRNDSNSYHADFIRLRYGGRHVLELRNRGGAEEAVE